MKAYARTVPVPDYVSPEYLCAAHAAEALELGERLRTLCTEGDEDQMECERCLLQRVN
jgi:hypothetical protein